jgi:hypothetical protein
MSKLLLVVYLLQNAHIETTNQDIRRLSRDLESQSEGSISKKGGGDRIFAGELRIGFFL